MYSYWPVKYDPPSCNTPTSQVCSLQDLPTHSQAREQDITLLVGQYVIVIQVWGIWGAQDESDYTVVHWVTGTFIQSTNGLESLSGCLMASQLACYLSGGISSHKPTTHNCLLQSHIHVNLGQCWEKAGPCTCTILETKNNSLNVSDSLHLTLNPPSMCQHV